MSNVPLNINLQQIALHLLNFAILFAALYFILYKPVKNFMDNREKMYKEREEKTKKDLEDAELALSEAREEVKLSKEVVKEMKAKAKVEIDKSKNEILDKANNEASDIVIKAKAEAKAEKDRIVKDAEKEIADLIKVSTEKIIKSEDASKSFDDFLKEANK